MKLSDNSEGFRLKKRAAYGNLKVAEVDRYLITRFEGGVNMADRPSPTKAAEMLVHMSPDSALTLYKLIVTVYNGDAAAQQYEKQKADEKEEAFLDLQNLRDEIQPYIGDGFDPEAELIAGLEEKYVSVG